MNKIGYFMLGAMAGGIAAWRITKKRYEQILQDEIDSVKEVFSNRKQSLDHNAYKEESHDIEEKTASEYSDILETKKYCAASENVSEPYVISPDEFGEKEDYLHVSFTYYKDHILADEVSCIVDNIDDTIGSDALNHFGEFEDDSVYVRNDRLKTDYEILLDQQRYSDYLKGRPHR